MEASGAGILPGLSTALWCVLSLLSYPRHLIGDKCHGTSKQPRGSHGKQKPRKPNILSECQVILPPTFLCFPDICCRTFCCDFRPSQLSPALLTQPKALSYALETKWKPADKTSFTFLPETFSKTPCPHPFLLPPTTSEERISLHFTNADPSS